MTSLTHGYRTDATSDATNLLVSVAYTYEQEAYKNCRNALELVNKQEAAADDKTEQQQQEDSRRSDEIFRDQLWSDYRDARELRLCSRCGLYNEYEIKCNSEPVKIDRYHGSELYEVSYWIDTKQIINPESLGDEQFYTLCKRCQAHIRGIQAYPLVRTEQQAQAELQTKREQEDTRRVHQKDKENAERRRIRIERIREERKQQRLDVEPTTP